MLELLFLDLTELMYYNSNNLHIFRALNRILHVNDSPLLKTSPAERIIIWLHRIAWQENKTKRLILCPIQAKSDILITTIGISKFIFEKLWKECISFSKALGAIY